jgi:beta-glucanase (GH16 family)
VDGNLHYTVNEAANRPIFETPMNIILNLAVGGLYGGDPNGTTVFPQVTDIDYVRVWQVVPEPATVILLMLTAAGWCLRRGRDD